MSLADSRQFCKCEPSEATQFAWTCWTSSAHDSIADVRADKWAIIKSTSGSRTVEKCSKSTLSSEKIIRLVIRHLGFRKLKHLGSSTEVFASLTPSLTHFQRNCCILSDLSTFGSSPIGQNSRFLSPRWHPRFQYLLPSDPLLFAHPSIHRQVRLNS